MCVRASTHVCGVHRAHLEFCSGKKDSGPNSQSAMLSMVVSIYLGIFVRTFAEGVDFRHFGHR